MYLQCLARQVSSKKLHNPPPGTGILQKEGMAAIKKLQLGIWDARQEAFHIREVAKPS
ncbi:MAG: hypothetical protein P8K76_13545 [Candidatus Binatia bacterium]|nr:hypothetical protein [Candidatus Binatia bacterium]MDG2010793.1 hypothetical protein [Candidatus Binatia bacterium]